MKPQNITANDALHYVLAKRVHITAYARVIVKDVQTAEDVFQEVCIAVLKKKDTFESEENILRWALAIARNKAVDEVRRRNRHATVYTGETLQLIADEMAREEYVSVKNEPDYMRLEYCMRMLTPRTRQLLLLRYAREKKPKDIAVMVGQKIQAVYKTMTRAHESLRVCMRGS